MAFLPKASKPVASTPTKTDGSAPGLITPPFQPKITSADAALTDKHYVINTQNNATAVNLGRLKTVTADLKGFAEGSPIYVTYYKDHYSETDIKGKSKETEVGSAHDAHNSILKINEFEIRLTGPLSYEHDTEDNNNSITGEGFTYPGFEPEEGDRFIMEIDTGKCGLMQIDRPPQRTSIRAATYFKITFHLESWMSESVEADLERAVVDVAWFDKTRFLNEPGALLNHAEYVELRFLEKQRARMINYYKSKFLDEVLMYSYMRPDQVYDPYVTDFMTKVLSYQEAGHFATQLYESAPFLKESIWQALLSANIPLEEVPTSSSLATYALGSKSVLANSLINKQYIFWKDSASLQSYLDGLDEYDKKFKRQYYPEDFVLTKTEYVLTTDQFFLKGVDYYTRSGSEGSYVYTKADVVIGKTIPPLTYYNKVLTYGFKPDTKYFIRKDGLYHLFDTEGEVPDPNVTYYTAELIGGGGASEEGTIPPDPTIPDITRGTWDEERILGDLLLHLHPHYTECPMMSDADSQSTGTTGEGIDLVLGGSNEYGDMLRAFLKYRSLDLRNLHICIENVWKLPRLQQFYKMAVYIWLAYVAMKYIRHQDGIFEIR